MGHERVGYLPKTKKWRALVDQLAPAGDDPESVASLAAQTIEAVRARYAALGDDPAVQEALTFLVEFAASNRGNEKAVATTGPLHVIQQLERRLPATSSLEVRELVHQASVDALLQWRNEKSPPWGELFVEQAPRSPFQGLGTGAGFSELARRFFSSLTTRYLKYFLEREASAEIPNVAKREVFGKQLEKHVEDLSRYSFETARITQSYAAGWFNKHVATREPLARSVIRRFLKYQLSKLREDLQRGGRE